MNLKTKIFLILSIVFVMFVINTISHVYTASTNMYNTAVIQKVEYEKKTQELVSFFDAKYLAFTAKEKIASVNKDVFITVSTIIMSNRKDGQQVAWKWVHENQNIPFEEFTSFYRDLSTFVEEQYGGVFEIEKQKQQIVNDNNRLLLIYPNNIINHFLHIPPIQYKFGYLSDSTRKLFNL